MTTTRILHDTEFTLDGIPFILVKDQESTRVLTVDTKVASEGVIVRAWRSRIDPEHVRFDFTPKQARALAEVLLAAADNTEKHGGNAPLPEEGCDRCACGSKYWDGDRCHSCGEKFIP